MHLSTCHTEPLSATTLRKPISWQKNKLMFSHQALQNPVTCLMQTSPSQEMTHSQAEQRESLQK